MTSTNNQITIRIGDYFDDEDAVIFHAFETTAPIDYDGFGTFTVANYGDSRTVLIRDEHQEWQLSRYASGNHTVTPTMHDVRNITMELWKRLAAKEESQ